MERHRREMEARSREEVEAARRAAEERFAAELRTLDAELALEKEAKAKALEAAEKRLAEIEQHAIAAGERIAGAEAPAHGGGRALAR